jgi:ATP-dependent DNA helicase RecG
VGTVEAHVITTMETDEQRTYFLTVLHINKDFLDEGNVTSSDEELVEGLVESQQAIIKLMLEDAHITKKKMAESIGISRTAVDKNITALKKRGLVERVGSDKFGSWKVKMPEK